MIRILYCEKTRMDYRQLAGFFLNNGLETECLPAEHLTAGLLSSTEVLLNAMDSFYPEEQLPLLVEYFQQGGHIINLNPAPFTVSLTSGQVNHRALRAFTMVDDFHPMDGTSSSVSTWYGEQAPLCLTGLTGGVYHLCEQQNGKNRRAAFLEHLMDAYDAEGNLLAAAILRIVTHRMGSMTLCNFDVADALEQKQSKKETCLSSADHPATADFVSNALLQTVRRCLAGTVLLTVDAGFSRFTPEERKDIHISAVPLTKKEGTSASLCLSVFRTELASDDEDRQQPLPHTGGSTHPYPPHGSADDTLVYEIREAVTLPYEAEISPMLTDSGLYRIEVSLSAAPETAAASSASSGCHADTFVSPNAETAVVIASCTTGFLVLTQEELRKEVTSFSPLTIDETISTDYCVRDGKTTAILGTTYFVTDVYRECFYSMNAWLCATEMQQLKKDGFNVLRSGNWYFLPEFYNEDGSIGTRGQRAMETFFYLASKNGFTVQFALGTVLLNQWDTSRSPIHDAGMRQKCMTLIRSFANAFRDFKNVQMDIVNEPSYSNRGAWSPGKPSMEAGEKIRYHEWLRKKYGTVQNLRAAWGETALTLRSFEDVCMPENELFYRGLARTEQRENHVMLNDFFCFAREEFSGWTKEIRAIVREIAPDMIVIMGRDETLRIPEQQTEILSGNIDMVCWHQWNYNSDIFTEYLMNRVRGRLCVAQELGMYKFDDIRSGKRHTDEEMIEKLNTKLLCSFGNFVQWQAQDDPFMWELSENSLGLYRADASPTPSLFATRRLIQAEKAMQHRMRHRNLDAVKICAVYGTSYHFGIEHPFALQGMRNFTYAMFHEIKQQADVMLEHLFTKENAATIGQPRLIILPAMQMLSSSVWEELLHYAGQGAVVLVNGCIDKTACFAPEAKIGRMDTRYRTRHLHDFETIEIDGTEYVLDFRRITGYADVSNVLDCGEILPDGAKTSNAAFSTCGTHSDDSALSFHGQTPSVAGITEYPVGKGSILYCPYPLELSGNPDAVAACYRYAIAKAGAENDIFRVQKNCPSILLNAATCEDCTVYTLMNEGAAGTVAFTDLQSRVTYRVTVDTLCSGKLWIDKTGKLLQTYGSLHICVTLTE